MNFQLISRCLDLAEDSVIITEADPFAIPGPKIIYVNKAFTQLTGYEYDEVMGKTPRILQGEKTSREELDKITLALEQEKYVRVELINYRKNGQPFWIELSISPIFDAQKNVEFFISVQKEISDRKEQEMLLQKTIAALEDKIDTLNQINIATVHDLKEPIRTIHSFLQLLERRIEGQLDETSTDYFTYIKSGAKRLAATINTLHQYSSFEKNIESKELCLSEAILAAEQNLLRKIRHKKASLSIEGNAIVAGNKSELTRLFQNLLDNALKHTHPDKRPMIRIEISEHNQQIQVLVKDNGIGIPPEFQEKVFRLFSKFNTPRSEEGLGAGLAICQKIVHKNNGSIKIHESSTDGTTFLINFPLMVSVANGSE